MGLDESLTPARGDVPDKKSFQETCTLILENLTAIESGSRPFGECRKAIQHHLDFIYRQIEGASARLEKVITAHNYEQVAQLWENFAILEKNEKTIIPEQKQMAVEMTRALVQEIRLLFEL
jgi:hypothetical protein